MRNRVPPPTKGAKSAEHSPRPGAEEAQELAGPSPRHEQAPAGRTPRSHLGAQPVLPEPSSAFSSSSSTLSLWGRSHSPTHAQQETREPAPDSTSQEALRARGGSPSPAPWKGWEEVGPAPSPRGLRLRCTLTTPPEQRSS